MRGVRQMWSRAESTGTERDDYLEQLFVLWLVPAAAQTDRRLPGRRGHLEAFREDGAEKEFSFCSGQQKFSVRNIRLWYKSSHMLLPKCSWFSLQLVIYSALCMYFFRPERYEGIGKVKKCRITEHQERRPRSEEDQVGGSKKQSRACLRQEDGNVNLSISLSIT